MRTRLTSSQAMPGGSGYEARAIPNPFEMMDPWEFLRNRIMGNHATGWEAQMQIARRYATGGGIFAPDRIIPRSLVISHIIETAGNGTFNFTFTFPTLSVVNGISAQMYNGNAADSLGNGTIRITAGSDGGTVIGTLGTATRLSALEQIPQQGGGLVRALQPTSSTAINPWDATVVMAGLIGTPNIILNLYGVALWIPEGQIQ